MSTNSIRDATDAGGLSVRQRISISPWVNEPYPNWDRILTAHDVTRLIRRPPWMLRTMAAVGRFPRKQRFHGKQIGWLKADILDWMARARRCRTTTTSQKAYCPRRRQPNPPNQQTLPLRYNSSPALCGQRIVSSSAGVSP